MRPCGSTQAAAAPAPLGGRSLQYVVSPSLPRQVQEQVQEARLRNTLSGTRTHSTPATKPRSSAEETLCEAGAASAAYQAYPTLPKLYGTLQNRLRSDVTDRQGVLSQQPYSTNDAAFSDTLSRIGPSARRLLGMSDDGDHTLETSSSKQLTTGSMKRPGGKRDTALASTAPVPSKAASLPRSTRRDFAGTATLGQRKTFSTRDVAKEVPLFTSTLTRDPQQEPPLVVTLREYLNRELRLSQDGALVVAGTDQLGPYREAFAALITAFPGYSSLLSDIRSAYDNVIQCQAELLTEAYSKEAAATLQQREITDSTQDLHNQVRALQTQLEDMRAELMERDAANEPDQKVTGQKGGTAAASAPARPRSSNGAILQRQVEQAESRVQELEQQSRSDMQKILVLISAVRDCDKRLHEYEIEVQRMAGQVSELDEFKRLAADAQAELVQYQQKFQAFVPSNDFEMMKDYLTEELATAQTTIRKLRRTAAVRGTQVDVMSRKLDQLEQNQAALVGDAGGSDLLTPRPNWQRIHEELPDLAEYTKPVYSAPLAAAAMTSDLAHDDDAQILHVEGLRASKLQVDYLAQRVLSLQEQLSAVTAEKNALEQRLRSAEADETPVPETIGQGRPVAARLQYGQPRRSQNGLDMSTTAASLNRPRGAVRSAYPIIASGLSSRVPSFARCVGTVERIVLTQTVCTRLLYDFFTQVLEPTLDVGVDTDLVPPSDLLVRFLSEEIPRNEDLNGRFDSVPHLVLNLIEDASHPNLTSPPLDVLVRVLHGAVPPRIAVESASVVKLAIADLQAMAKEQQTKRLRRSALAECLFPVLELKTSHALTELRACLGSELTFDVSILTALENRFMSTLFFQECRANLEFYATIVDALTKEADKIGGFNEVDRSLHLSSVAAVIFRCEPLTPQVVLRELSENAVHKDVAADDAEGGQHDTNRRDSASATPPEDVPIRLSELLQAIATAPLIRRTRHSTKEQCNL